MIGYKLFHYLFDISEKLPKIIKNIIQKFIIKKINRKIFKIYFLPTKKSELPSLNYIHKENLEYQIKLIQKFSKTGKQGSSMTCPHLIQLMLLNFDMKEKISFLDFGGEKIDFFLNLQKNFLNLEYFFFNQKPINELFKKIKLQFNYDKLHIIENFSEIYKQKFDFLNFGSTIQYVDNYEEILSKLSINNRFIFFSGTHLYDADGEKFDKNIIVKQVNILPQINHLYFFNRKKFYEILTKKNFELVFEEKNLTDRIRYNNFNSYLKNIEYSDFLFKKK